MGISTPLIDTPEPNALNEPCALFKKELPAHFSPLLMLRTTSTTEAAAATRPPCHLTAMPPLDNRNRAKLSPRGAMEDRAKWMSATMHKAQTVFPELSECRLSATERMLAPPPCSGLCPSGQATCTNDGLTQRAIGPAIYPLKYIYIDRYKWTSNGWTTHSSGAHFVLPWQQPGFNHRPEYLCLCGPFENV